MDIKSNLCLICSAPVFCSLGSTQTRRTKLISGRVGEAAAAGLTSIIAAGAGGVGQAAQKFGFRNATRAANAEQRCCRRSSAAQQTRNASSSRGDPEGSRPRHRAVCGRASRRRNGRHHALAGRNGGIGSIRRRSWCSSCAGSCYSCSHWSGCWSWRSLGQIRGERTNSACKRAAVGGLGAATLGLGLGAVGGAYEGARYMLGGNAGDGSLSHQPPTSERSTTCSKGPETALRAAPSSAADGV